jgi:plasmid stability protein
VATLKIPDQTLTRLRAAAAARHVSVEAYLDEMAALDTAEKHASSSAASGQFRKNSVAERIAAADSIRKLATEVKDKATIEELIADKHAGHRY